MTERPEVCRVCLKDDTLDDPLLQVCDCNLMLVHKSCAEEWLQFTSQTHCPYCGFKVIVKYYHQWLPKQYYNYLNDTPEDVDEVRELCLRTLNWLNMTALSFVIWYFNPFSCFSTKTIMSILFIRAFFVIRLWYLFYRKTAYSLNEWQKTHFKVEVFPNPNPKKTKTPDSGLQTQNTSKRKNS